MKSAENIEIDETDETSVTYEISHLPLKFKPRFIPQDFSTNFRQIFSKNHQINLENISCMLYGCGKFD